MWLDVAELVDGIDFHANGSPLFFLPPRCLGVALCTRDHEWHYMGGGRSNFSKWFTLWDCVFGTYGSPPLPSGLESPTGMEAGTSGVAKGSARLLVRTSSANASTASMSDQSLMRGKSSGGATVAADPTVAAKRTSSSEFTSTAFVRSAPAALAARAVQ